MSMTTEADRARPRGISRIDPALRDAAASLDIVEFHADSLPAERERADRLMVELRVIEPVQKMDRAWPRGRHAHTDLTRELRVGARHERRHLLVAYLDEVE